MNLQPKNVKTEAALRLSNAPGNYKKIILLYSLITLGAGLLCQLIFFVTDLMIANTGGLSGMATRTILKTVQAGVPALINSLMIIWVFGLTRTVLLMTRQERLDNDILLSGFRRFSSVLRMYLVLFVIYWVLLIVTLQALTLLLSFLPYGAQLLDPMMAYAEDPALMEAAMTDPEIAAELLVSMWPLLAIWMSVAFLVSIPVTYCLRLCFYRIMDDNAPGAIRSAIQSFKLMKGHVLDLFKLDLSFWWYYLLTMVTALIVEIPAFLPAPYNAEWAYLVFAAIHALVSLWIYTRFLLRVESAYAVFYDMLLEEKKAPAPPQPYWQYPQQ